MNLRAHTFILASIAAAASAAGAPPPQGQDASETTTVTLDQPGKPQTAAPAPEAVRPPSQSISAIISSGLPAYSPKESQPKAVVPADDAKAKNEMPRLPLSVMPRYVVREKKAPEFSELELYTKSGLIDLAFKRDPWLHLFNFFGLKREFAYRTIRDQELAAETNEITTEAVELASMGDPQDAKVMQQAIIDEHFESNFEDTGGGGPVR